MKLYPSLIAQNSLLLEPTLVVAVPVNKILPNVMVLHWEKKKSKSPNAISALMKMSLSTFRRKYARFTLNGALNLRKNMLSGRSNIKNGARLIQNWQKNMMNRRIKSSVFNKKKKLSKPFRQMPWQRGLSPVKLCRRLPNFCRIFMVARLT
ncbi:MAG: hypothetical protein BWX60_00727 [Candidatus Marinimicrobia bacterium ADurb.Bin030]|nr:MAG: hypothetical protein BWX60_00727 [Candidatus Marinimicrobia bacterium ADurb.Bin030]